MARCICHKLHRAIRMGDEACVASYRRALCRNDVAVTSDALHVVSLVRVTTVVRPRMVTTCAAAVGGMRVSLHVISLN